MIVTIIASGSKSNCLILEIGGARVMVDAGLGHRQTFERMLAAGLEPESLDFIAVTHCHLDHVYGLPAIARKLDIPVFMSGGCYESLKPDQRPRKVMRFQPGQSFKVGKLTVGTVLVPHDAAEPTAFTLTSSDEKFAMATDLGSVPDAMVKAFSGADIAFCESNHDPALARLGDKHPAVLKRVLGPLGHLSNDALAELLKRGLPGTSQFIIGHLSREDNTEELARLTAMNAIKGNCDLKVAGAEGGVS